MCCRQNGIDVFSSSIMLVFHPKGINISQFYENVNISDDIIYSSCNVLSEVSIFFQMYIYKLKSKCILTLCLSFQFDAKACPLPRKIESGRTCVSVFCPVNCLFECVSPWPSSVFYRSVSMLKILCFLLFLYMFIL